MHCYQKCWKLNLEWTKELAFYVLLGRIEFQSFVDDGIDDKMYNRLKIHTYVPHWFELFFNFCFLVQITTHRLRVSFWQIKFEMRCVLVTSDIIFGNWKRKRTKKNYKKKYNRLGIRNSVHQPKAFSISHAIRSTECSNNIC